MNDTRADNGEFHSIQPGDIDTAVNYTPLQTELPVKQDAIWQLLKGKFCPSFPRDVLSTPELRDVW